MTEIIPYGNRYISEAKYWISNLISIKKLDLMNISNNNITLLFRTKLEVLRGD